MKTILFVAVIAMAAVPQALAEGDATRGKQVFQVCSACHQIGEGARHGMGPQLNGLIGRTAGTAEGFNYSPAMVEAGEDGLVWSEETLGLPEGYACASETGFRPSRDVLPPVEKEATGAPIAEMTVEWTGSSRAATSA